MKSQLVVRISMTVYDNESGPGIVFDGQPTWNTIEIWVTKGMKEVIINTLPVDRGKSCLEAALEEQGIGDSRCHHIQTRPARHK